MRLFIFLTIFSLAYRLEAEVKTSISLNEYAPSFQKAFGAIHHKKPNFNSEDYLFTYPCGGGAVCGSIFDSSLNRFVSLPDDFIGASEVEEFNLKFTSFTNEICIWGQSAYNSKIYNGQCFMYKNGEVLPKK